jgi:hypothetical protein
MAFDSLRNASVLTVDGASLLETWVWDGASWTPRLPTNSPPRRNHHAMAYDRVRDFVVLFAGQISTNSSGAVWRDTWEWDGSDWILRSQTTGPPGRERHALVYDPIRQRTLLFGGVEKTTTTTIFNDTWEWDGASWTQRSPVTSPAPRYGHAMAWDSARNRAVLFGGQRDQLLYNDTWEWDGNNWTERFPAAAPSARQGAVLAYDSQNARTFLFGGEDFGGVLGDTWEYDGSQWRLLVPAARPARRAEAAMIYDSNRRVLVLYGGSNGAFLRDTWEYTPGASGSYSFFGAGCAGPRGTPTLSVFGGQVPRAGQAFSVQVGNLPLTGPVWMFLGLSKTNYNGLPLPADLSILGMLNCRLYVSGDLIFPVQNILGVGLWTITVPGVLAGVPIFNQAIVFDPDVNPLSLTVSNAGEGVVGS